MKTLICAALAAGFLPLAATAHDAVAIRDAYVRVANPMSGAAFMTIDNHRKVECRLIGAASDAAARVELHTNVEEDGVMRMVKLEDGIAVPASGQHALERGGDHIMLMGLTQPLTDGDSVLMTLDFGDCGSERLLVPVDNTGKPAGAASEDADDQTGH